MLNKVTYKTAVNVPTGILLLLAAYKLGNKLFRRWAISRFTVLSELPELGTPRKDGRKICGTVVICGGRCVFFT
jgi:hypothetical protein